MPIIIYLSLVSVCVIVVAWIITNLIAFVQISISSQCEIQNSNVICSSKKEKKKKNNTEGSSLIYSYRESIYSVENITNFITISSY